MNRLNKENGLNKEKHELQKEKKTIDLNQLLNVIRITEFKANSKL